MTLLTISEIQQGLNRKFAPLEPLLTGFRLIPAGVPEMALVQYERELATPLPSAFRNAIQTFDFGRLTVGPVAFGSTGDYLKELRNLNTNVKWWGEGKRPANLLMVANSDPYAILLDLVTAGVRAMDAERGWKNATDVANGFLAYLRGLGTAMLRRESVADKLSFANELLADVGGADLAYWVNLLK
jgi:hypothetical protein